MPTDFDDLPFPNELSIPDQENKVISKLMGFGTWARGGYMVVPENETEPAVSLPSPSLVPGSSPQ